MPQASIAGLRASIRSKRIASGRQIAINGHIKFNLTIPLQQLNGLETLVIIMVANKYAFLQITRRRFLNEWEAFKKVISRRNIRRRITIPLTLSNLKLLRRITRTEDRKSGSAGMPRPISYAVFCLKKKIDLIPQSLHCSISLLIIR